MRKLCYSALALAGSVAPAFAETGSFTLANNDVGGEVLTGLTTWASTATPALVGIAGVFMGFWLVKMILRLIKGVASASK